MTLYRQILAGIMVLLAGFFIGTAYISTGNLRDFLVTGLDAHTQDTATSLGLSISPHMPDDDIAVIESMIDAIFDRGDFREIVLLGTDGDTLVEKEYNSRPDGVPQWFIDTIALQAPMAEALVMADWKQAGSIHVTSNTDAAYRELWGNVTETFWLFLACTAVFLLLAPPSLRLLLRPLREVEKQAGAICNNDYVVQQKLPRTRELHRVILAMNRLAEKVGNFFREQSAITEKIRAQSYRDPLTGLGNRRYFSRRIEALLGPGEQTSQGALLLLELRDFARLNETAGFVTGDRVIARVAEIISRHTAHFEHSFAARISGAGFAIVAAGLASESADALADSICHDLLQLRADGLVEAHDIGHIGIAMWQQSNTPADLLSEADIALRAAQACGQNTWQRFAPAAANQSFIFSEQHWREKLQDTLDRKSLILESQPVYGTGDRARSILHHEVLARIPDSRGNGIAASVFIPMAERLHMASQLDKLSTSILIDHLLDSKNTGIHAMNLSHGALHDTVFLRWLCSRLGHEHHLCKRLMVEFPEYAATANLQNARDLVERLGELGCRCGIDHFGRSFHPFGYLRTLDIDYLKIDGSFTRDIDTDEDNQFFLRSLTDAVHGIDIDVIAQSVETPAERSMLESLGMDGVQGYLTGKPGPLALAACVI